MSAILGVIRETSLDKMAESFLLTVVCSVVLEPESLQEHRAREAMMETHVLLPLSLWCVGLSIVPGSTFSLATH